MGQDDQRDTDARERLIVALDVADVAAARATVARLEGAVGWFKIGHRLAYGRGGMDFARDLAREQRVFLDLKLLDIDNTVEGGVRAVADNRAGMLTVHAYPHAMRAAVRGAAGSSLVLLAVSVLTSMDDGDLAEAGYGEGAEALVARRAEAAREAGMGGVVSSPLEAARVREIVGPDMAVVTPGIRPSGAARGDQKRVATPASALRAGASHIVVGRPIIEAPDPRAAAERILEQMEEHHG